MSPAGPCPAVARTDDEWRGGRWQQLFEKVFSTRLIDVRGKISRPERASTPLDATMRATNHTLRSHAARSPSTRAGTRSIVTGALLGLCFAAAACPGAPEVDVPAPPATKNLSELVDTTRAKEIQQATRTVTSTPKSADAWHGLGVTYEVSEVVDRAVSCYLTAASLEPENPRHYYRASISAARAQELDAAVGHMRKTVALDPEYGPAWRRLGFFLLDLGELDEARAAFQKTDALLPEFSDAQVGLARTALLADDVDAAVAHASEALDRLPDHAYIRLLLGEALRRQGKTAEAAPHLQAGEGAVPAFLDPWSEEVQSRRNRDETLMGKAAKLIEQKRYADAIEIYNDILTRRPDDVKLLLRKGVALMSARRFDDAAAFYDGAVETISGNYELMSGRAAALIQVGRDDDAARATDSMIERWPERASAYVFRGQLQAKAGQVERARQSFQKATEVEPSNLRGRLLEARMLLGKSRSGDAVMALTSNYDLQSSSPPMAYFKILLQAQSAAGSGQAALRATYERAIQVHGDQAKGLMQRR